MNQDMYRPTEKSDNVKQSSKKIEMRYKPVHSWELIIGLRSETEVHVCIKEST